MQSTRYSDSQMMAILKPAEAGSTVPDLCREHGMSSASFSQWRAKFDGIFGLFRCQYTVHLTPELAV